MIRRAVTIVVSWIALAELLLYVVSFLATVMIQVRAPRFDSTIEVR